VHLTNSVGKTPSRFICAFAQYSVF